MNPSVSIIVRTKNEERWISLCLEGVFGQEYDGEVEVVVVDNESTDRTVEKATAFDVRVVSIDHYKPGRALNHGIRNGTGDVIVCLSGHCIPVRSDWLKTLVRNVAEPNVAGVYGRQEPLSFTPDRDKRDLLTVFGLDRRVQVRDSFFHNANSAFRREIWERYPFDEDTTNVEDRIWAQEVIRAGYNIVYEPEASVYHYHGIYHDGDQDRRRRIVEILESLELATSARQIDGLPTYVKGEGLTVTALIPVRGPVRYCGERPLLEFTVERAAASHYVRDVVVLADDEEQADVARRSGARVPFLRPPELSQKYVDVRSVIEQSFGRLEEVGCMPDICIVLEETFPFRAPTLIDDLIEMFLREGIDGLIPVRREERALWVREGDEIRTISALMPRAFKTEHAYVSLFGLGFTTYAKNIRNGDWGLDNLGMYEVADEYSSIEVRDDASLQIAENLLRRYWESHPTTQMT